MREQDLKCDLEEDPADALAHLEAACQAVRRGRERVAKVPALSRLVDSLQTTPPEP